MKSLTTILILNYNASAFIDNSLYALSKLTKNKYQVVIADNNSKIDDYRSLQEIVKNYPGTILKRINTKSRFSMAHGEGMNYLIKFINTPYFSIIDPDATWLIKSWDQLLIDRLNDRVKAIGSQATTLNRPQDFPLIYTILFETKTFKKMKIDFRPKDISKNIDVGWEIREKYHAAGFKGEVLIFKNTRTFHKGPFKGLIGIGEYYLKEYPSKIFSSHFGRGSSLGSAKYARGLTLYLYSVPVIGKYFLKRKGMNEIKLWLKICRDIIDTESKKD